MQIKNNHANYLQNPWIIGLLKILLLGGCLYFLHAKFQSHSFSLNLSQLPDDFGIVVIAVLLLMVVNWYLEAWRWKVAMEPFEPISMQKAWQVVLGGLTLNWVLPFTSGDLLARISQQQDKYQATSAAMLNRGVMLGFTLIIGLYGMSHLAQAYELNGWFLLIILFGIPLVKKVFKKSLDRFAQYFKKLNRKLLMQIVAISFIRYIVFVFQFYLLLWMFLPFLSSEVLVAGIGWVFLIRSVLPLFFGGFGVREASGIVFFEPHVQSLQLVLIPVFLIWVINTVIPSVAGLVFILRFRASGGGL